MPYFYHILPEANIREVLLSNWESFDTAPLEGGSPWPGNAQALLLRSPLWQNEKVFCLAKIWKRHLVAIGYPEVKLITLGFVPNEHQHPNYIDLLKLPEDLTTFIENAAPSSANWEPMDTMAPDLYHKLYRFLRGHDDHSSDSLVVGFTRLNELFRSLTGLINSGKPYQEAVQAIIAGDLFPSEINAELLAKYHPLEIWKLFTTRFHNYHQFFDNSPIKHYFEQIHDHKEVIASFFTSSWQKESLLSLSEENIFKIYEVLDKLEKDYVR